MYLQLALHMNRDFIIWNFFFIIFNKNTKNIVKLLIKKDVISMFVKYVFKRFSENPSP